MPTLMLVAVAPWENLVQRMQDLLEGAENGTLQLLLFLAVLAVGWALAALASRLVGALLRLLHFDEGLRGLRQPGVAAWTQRPADIVTWAVYWIILAFAVVLGLDSLGFELSASVAERLRDVLPRVAVSALLLLTGVLAAVLLGYVARRLFEGAGMKGARLRAQIVTAVFTVFAVLLALEQLGFAAQFVMAVGVIAFAAVGLALGLAFGLGCRDLARDFVVEYLRSLDEEGPRRPS